MPRAPRIEFEGAIYHVMARGNRREPIVFSDEDRELFVKTLGDACTRAGWEIFAWVLMDNHYHFVLRTPNANLVSGMQWFQNAYTRRLNSRHKLWGHLFGGRYRAILVENESTGTDMWREYLQTVIDYVHLNPGRSGVVDGNENSVIDYPWSSLAQGYIKSPTKRPDWLAVAEGLNLFQYRDTASGRKRMTDRLDHWLRSESGSPELEGVSLESRVRRGWFWGSEKFREKMLKRLEKGVQRTSRDYQSSPAERDHNEKRANQIIKEGLRFYKLKIDELRRTVRGDWKRSSVAWAVAKETTVSQGWISRELSLSSAANASQQIRRFDKVKEAALPAEVRKWKLSRNVA